MATNYERIIVRKKNELIYAKKRLARAEDEYTQYAFAPDFVGSLTELALHVNNWNQHISSLEAEIVSYEQKLKQQSMQWGLE